MISFLDKLCFYPTSLVLRVQLAVMRRLLSGPYRWYALDRLGIAGHGTDLIRLDFPPAVDAQPRWGHGRPPHPELDALFQTNAGEQLELLRACLASSADFRSWPAREDPTEPALPWRQNEFLLPCDAATLYGMLRHFRPERYLEVGSGMSTRIAWQARRNGAFPMEIVSIDPEPRLVISGLCDRVERRPLESLSSSEVLSLITPRTVIFFDGSHRSLPGSDVTFFFLDLLPRLPRGVLVQIHDIHLPADYAPEVFNRYWSEQYLLAAYLLGGAHRLEILLPCARLGTQPESRTLLAAALGEKNTSGSSLWLRMK